MMVDVDDLTRRFGHIISHHIAITDFLRSRDQAKHPHSYTATKFSNFGNINIT